MKNDKKAMIQTIVLSVLMPLICFLEVLCFLYLSPFGIIPIGIAASAAYYFVVMRERKSDVLTDAHVKRIWCSLLIQAVLFLCVFYIPYIYRVSTHSNPEAGDLSPIDDIILYYELIQPLCVHIGGLLFRFFIGLFTKMKGRE